VQQDSNLRSAD